MSIQLQRCDANMLSVTCQYPIAHTYGLGAYISMYIRSMCSSIGGFVNWLQDDVHATQHGCSAYLLDGVAHEWRAARLPPSVPRPGPTTVFILHSPTRCSPQGSLDKLAWYVSEAWLGRHHVAGLVQLRGPRPAERSAAKAAKAAHGNNAL